MSVFNFDDLVARFGETIALHCLHEIEKAARISPGYTSGLDPETRLSNAVRAQDEAMLVSA